MRIRYTWFKWWSILNGTITRTVHVQKTKDGYWTKHSQRKVLAALKDTKGIEVIDGPN